MNQTENRSDVVAEALAAAKKAGELTGAAITQLLAQREQIERDLKTLGYSPEHNGNGAKSDPASAAPKTAPAMPVRKSWRFKKMILADIGAALIREHGPLHGKKIEELAKAGGFKGGTKNFQNYMPVAFKRDGRFINIGGNTWKLKDATETT
jgi:hypothetical protein